MKNKFNIMLELSFCSYVHFAVSFFFLILPTRRHRNDYTVFESMPLDSSLTINIVQNIVCANINVK